MNGWRIGRFQWESREIVDLSSLNRSRAAAGMGLRARVISGTVWVTRRERGKTVEFFFRPGDEIPEWAMRNGKDTLASAIGSLLIEAATAGNFDPVYFEPAEVSSSKPPFFYSHQSVRPKAADYHDASEHGTRIDGAQ